MLSPKQSNTAKYMLASFHHSVSKRIEGSMLFFGSLNFESVKPEKPQTLQIKLLMA